MTQTAPVEIPTISASIAVDVASALKRAGVDPQAVFNEAGIDIKATKDPYQRVRLDRYTYLLEVAALKANCPLLCLGLGSHQDPSKWGAFGYVVLNSPTVGTALSNIATFLKPWQGGTHVAYINRGDRIGIEYSILHPKVTFKDQDAEFGIAYIKNVVDRLCKSNITPIAVGFEHHPLEAPSAYKKVLGVTPHFEQSVNSITYPRLLEGRAVLAADTKLYPIVRHHLVDMAKLVPDDFDLIAAVTYHIRQSLPGLQCKLEHVASNLAMGPRTLQRRLNREGTNFGQILENTRKVLAVEHLESSTLEIKEIGYLLGFYDTSAFIKAFKKWTGKTPAKFREETPH